MTLWRFAVTSYLWKANRDGLLRQSSLPEEFNELILKQVQRDVEHPHHPENVQEALSGICRALYPSASHLPETHSQGDGRRSRLPGKDTKTKTLVETRCTPAEFVAMLSPHVLDRYQHSMRYFGLLAPRTKRLSSAVVFALLGQRPRPKPPRQRWADSLKKHFGVDPLIDQFGNRMHWVGHRQPVPVP